MASDRPVVVLEHLTKKYGTFTALDDLSLTLSAGQVFGLIGPNGAGKTTAIKILVGLSRPTSGAASIAGVDCVGDSRNIKRLVGYMPDRFGSYDNMRVREYLDFFGAAFGIPRRQRVRRIEETMETNGKLRAVGTVEQIGRQVSQQRTIEAHLTGSEQLSAAAAIIRRGIEPGAE